jgi:hypothetical protein
MPLHSFACIGTEIQKGDPASPLTATHDQPAPGISPQVDDRLTPAELVERSFPGLEVARHIGFRELWELFQDSGFLYPEKMDRLQHDLPEIERTITRLIAANGSLINTIGWRRGGRLSGHVCALRAYRSTWMFQHLAARRRDLGTSSRMSHAITYLARLRADVEWIKMSFRPNNRFPSKAYGSYARLIADPWTSDLRTFYYMTAGLVETSNVPPGVEVRVAEDSDLPFVAEWFTILGRIPELMANDLCPWEARLQTIEKEFAAIGLERHREIFVSERHGRSTGFALLEISSRGMNLSGFTNAFTVHVMEDDPDSKIALIIRARDRCRELNQREVIALAEESDVSAFQALGFEKSKEYMCWTFHRNHLTDGGAHLRRVLG